MPPQQHSITLRFIRRTPTGLADTNPANDDILRITKLGENNLRVIYTERSEAGPQIDVMTYSYATCIAYLYRVFWLLGLDEDPFQSVQLGIPGYPTCLVQVAELRQNLQHIMELMMNSCIAWPTSGRPARPPSSDHPTPSDRPTPSDTTSTTEHQSQ